MNYWLAKSEPGTFSWDDLERDGISMWDGVRNYQARNNLRKMEKGDTVFFYYSGKNPGIIGIAEVVKEHYPDPTATNGDWSVVDIKPIRKFNHKISLQDIKEIEALQNMSLVRSFRLSVQPVRPEEYALIMGLEQNG
jgi:predicted RNA-binding protein with PUA-like domain